LGRVFTLLAVFALLPAAHALAAADVATSREKAKVCTPCHGETGVSATLGIPSLAGQQDQFIQWQLVFFRSGRRPNPVMTPIVAELTDADIRNLGAYFVGLPYFAGVGAPATPAEAPDAAQATGKTVADRHRCTSCHRDNFRGERAAASIAGEREEYLVKAPTEYRSTARASTGVAAMNEAAAGLNDDDIAAVAHYVATVAPAPK
jgi:cytochrome c553